MFSNEQYMPAWKKEQILSDWQRFIRGGFRFRHFSPELYEHLTLNCSFQAHSSRRRFWEDYFDSKADALAVFMNQFGGSKVTAETRWVDWRGGSAADLKEAMSRAAEAVWPTFEQRLTTWAVERYEEEKWADAQQRAQGLSLDNISPARMTGLMGLLIELVFPIEVYLSSLQVDEALRDYLDMTTTPVIEDPDPLPDFSAIDPPPVSARHLSLFEAPAQETRDTTRYNDISLSERIAALTEAADAQPDPPLVIEREKAMSLYI